MINRGNQVKIVSIATSKKKGTIKKCIDQAELVENHGIKEDAHAGDWHRQLSFLAAESIEKAGTLDSVEVREAVLTHEFKGTVMGDVKYGPDGIAGAKIAANQWWNGERKLVYPFFKDVQKVQLAPPWGKR